MRRDFIWYTRTWRIANYSKLLMTHVVVLSVANFVITKNVDFDVPERIGRAARGRIVSEAVLRAEFAIDLVEDDSEICHAVRKEHSAARGFRDGLQSMFAGRVASVFTFHGSNQNRVKKRVGAHGRLACGFEIGVACSFAAIGDKNDDVAAFPLLRGKAF